MIYPNFDCFIILVFRILLVFNVLELYIVLIRRNLAAAAAVHSCCNDCISIMTKVCRSLQPKILNIVNMSVLFMSWLRDIVTFALSRSVVTSVYDRLYGELLYRRISYLDARVVFYYCRVFKRFAI